MLTHPTLDQLNHDSYATFDRRALNELQRRGSTEFPYAASRAYAAEIATAFRPKR